MTDQRRNTWHKSLNRMTDPDYTMLSPGAKAMIAALEEVGEASGNAARCAGVLGLDRKTFARAIEQLKGKFITLEESEGVYRIALVKSQLCPTKVPLEGEQGASCGRVGHKQSANYAGSGDRSLKENENKKENKKPPVVPQDEAIQKARLGALRMASPKPGNWTEVEAWWSDSQPDDDTFSKILAGIERDKALYSQRNDFAKVGWQFFPSTSKYLQERRWEVQPVPMTEEQRQAAEADERDRRRRTVVAEWHRLTDDPETPVEKLVELAPLVKELDPWRSPKVDHMLYLRGVEVRHVG